MRNTKIALLTIIGLGIALRFFVLLQRGSFWFDEAFAVHFASMDIPRMLAYLRFENNPPFYFILLHFWMKLFGNSEIAVRMLSMVFGIGALPLIYCIGKRLHSSAAGLFAAFLLALSTFQVFYATETRMYTMYLIAALAAIYLFISGKHKSLFIVLLVMVWTHITAWFIPIAFAAYLLWNSRFNLKSFIGQNVKFITVGVLLVLQFLPWVVHFVQLKIAAPLSQGYLFYIPSDKNFFLSILENFIVFGQDNAFIVTLLSVLIVGLFWFAIYQSKAELLEDKEHKAQLLSIRFLLCWLFIPLFIGFAFSNAIPRYFIAVAPALYLLMGVGFANFIESIKGKYTLRKLYVLHTTFYILTFALIFPDYPSLIKISHHEWGGLALWVEQVSGTGCQVAGNCLVLVNPHSEILPFERYYRGALPVVGFYPKDDSDDRDARIVKTNWVSLNTKENVPRLRDVTEGYTVVFLVTGGVDPVGRNLVPVWFWENGWHLGKSQEFGKMSVMVLAR